MGRNKKSNADFIVLTCKSCGKVRRDVKNDKTFSITATLLKKFNVQEPKDLEAVYLCLKCRKGQKPIKKEQVCAEIPSQNIETEPKNEQNIKYLIPTTEEKYISRKISGTSDLSMLETAYKNNYNVLIYGDAGMGKSHIARFFAFKNKLPYKRLNLNGATTPEQLVGQFIPNGSQRTFKWVDGWLTTFMRNGGVLVLDEINMAQADILALLNPILDRERTLVLTEKDGEVIKAHKDFFVISTMNLNYEGTKPLNESLKDRFNLILEFDYDDNIDKKLIKSQKILDYASKIRTAHQNCELTTPLSTRTLINFERNIDFFGEKIAFTLLLNRFEKHERKVLQEIWNIMNNIKPETETKTEDAQNGQPSN